MKPGNRSRGITLIELLVSISIGLVVVGAMVALYIATARGYRQFDALAQLQSNARYVFEIMGYDIRMAGNMSCHVPWHPKPTNFIADYNSRWWSNTDRPLLGIKEGADGNAKKDAGFPAEYGDDALRGDSVIVLRANPDEKSSGIVASYGSGSPDPIQLESGKFEPGDLLLLTDCRTTSSVFQVSGDKGGIGHGTELSSSVAGPLDMAGAKLVQLSANAYYLRESPYAYASSRQKIPSLYRQALVTIGGLATTRAEELVSGVTDLQIRYGVDENGDGVLDRYVDANAVTAWEQVTAVRVTITLETTDDAVATESSRFTLGNGSTITDRRLRRSYTATFGLRERLS